MTVAREYLLLNVEMRKHQWDRRGQKANTWGGGGWGLEIHDMVVCLSFSWHLNISIYYVNAYYEDWSILLEKVETSKLSFSK